MNSDRALRLANLGMSAAVLALVAAVYVKSGRAPERSHPQQLQEQQQDRDSAERELDQRDPVPKPELPQSDDRVPQRARDVSRPVRGAFGVRLEPVPMLEPTKGAHRDA